MIGRVDRNVSNSPLGLQSTIFVILVVFVSTAYFFWKVITLTLHKSRDAGGVFGVIAKCVRFTPQAAPVKVKPRQKLDIKLMMQAVEQKRRDTQVKNIEESSRMHKERLMIRIKKSQCQRGSRLQARLAARAKIKRQKLSKSARHLPLLKPSPSLRLWIVWSAGKWKVSYVRTRSC